MPNTYDTDYGPQHDEDQLRRQVRSDVGKFVGALMGRRIQEGKPIPDVRVLDYISSQAGTLAINSYNYYFQLPNRTNSVGLAKSWAAGYFEWYFPPVAPPNHAAWRDDVQFQPNFWDTVHRGALVRANDEYRNFPWTIGIVRMPYGPWQHPDINDDDLERINRNLKGETVLTWSYASFRQQVFGRAVSCYLPQNVRNAGLTLQIGGELYSDWIEAKDENHGHPMTTVRNAYAARDNVFAQELDNRSGVAERRAFKVFVGAANWRIVFNQGNPPVIITMFKYS